MRADRDAERRRDLGPGGERVELAAVERRARRAPPTIGSAAYADRAEPDDVEAAHHPAAACGSTSVKSLVYWISTDADEQNIDDRDAREHERRRRQVPADPREPPDHEQRADRADAAPRRRSPAPPNARSTPNRIASTAASELPDEMPSVNGSASGLRSSACSAQPAPASAPPTSSDASTRGSRTTKIACVGRRRVERVEAEQLEVRGRRGRRRCRSAARRTAITRSADADRERRPTSRAPVSRSPRAADEAAHAGTANGSPDGSVPTWIVERRTPRGSPPTRARRPACRAPRAGRRRRATSSRRSAARDRDRGSRRPPRRRRRTARAASANTPRACAGSSPAVGSSSSRQRAPWHSACARITRRASPPDSSSNRRAARCVDVARRHRRARGREVVVAREPEPALAARSGRAARPPRRRTGTRARSAAAGTRASRAIARRGRARRIVAEARARSRRAAATSPAIARSSVVLPAPLGPTTTTSSPASTCRGHAAHDVAAAERDVDRRSSSSHTPDRSLPSSNADGNAVRTESCGAATIAWR